MKPSQTPNVTATCTARPQLNRSTPSATATRKLSRLRMKPRTRSAAMAYSYLLVSRSAHPTEPLAAPGALARHMRSPVRVEWATFPGVTCGPGRSGGVSGAGAPWRHGEPTLTLGRPVHPAGDHRRLQRVGPGDGLAERWSHRSPF